MSLTLTEHISLKNESFNASCQLKGSTYLNKPADLSYMWPFSGQQTLKN